MDAKKIKIVGVVLAIAGFVVNMASDWLSEKKLDAKIAEKIAEQISTSEKNI